MAMTRRNVAGACTPGCKLCSRRKRYCTAGSAGNPLTAEFFAEAAPYSCSAGLVIHLFE